MINFQIFSFIATTHVYYFAYKLDSHNESHEDIDLFLKPCLRILDKLKPPLIRLIWYALLLAINKPL